MHGAAAVIAQFAMLLLSRVLAKSGTNTLN
jgi:hypothetical protein